MPDRLERKNADADPIWERTEVALRLHASRDVPRYEQLWAYYRNPLGLVGRSGRDQNGWYRQAQETGLPTRIRGVSGAALGVGAERGRREVVIENDIGWRVHTMVDFMFGRPVRFESLVEDAEKKAAIEAVLERVWERSGGIVLMQDMALLGHVFGHVDLLVRVDEAAMLGGEPGHGITVEPIEARRGIAMLAADDYREIETYAVHAEREVVQEAPVRRGVLGRRRSGTGEAQTIRAGVTEVFTGTGRVVYRDGAAISREPAAFLRGRVPVVHIQNVGQPFVYAGLGEVEPLIPLQDELNTRLSDRANRVTLQSFKMYLAKGIESFDSSGIGPGMVWTTDNPDASIEAFGGDAHSPSEDAHIEEVREAMDKVSGTPPLAGGVVQAKLGNLSSANALRVTLMGLIAKTMRKRVSYGRGMERVCEMVLEALDQAGSLRTDESERGVRVVWPGLVFEDEGSQLAAAAAKTELGVPGDRVLGELGYGDADPGVV